ncbi:Fc.00g036420.m01.CDS01 [Cosmosporella sp. VM-42]
MNFFNTNYLRIAAQVFPERPWLPCSEHEMDIQNIAIPNILFWDPSKPCLDPARRRNTSIAAAKVLRHRSFRTFNTWAKVTIACVCLGLLILLLDLLCRPTLTNITVDLGIVAFFAMFGLSQLLDEYDYHRDLNDLLSALRERRPLSIYQLRNWTILNCFMQPEIEKIVQRRMLARERGDELY